MDVPSHQPTAHAHDLVVLVEHALNAQQAIDFVSDPAAGGIDVFLGTTRAERAPDGRELVALDYEAYREMALEQMRDLARRARAHWPIVRLALLHRTGRVELAEPSVVIAVSCGHRAESFDACRFLIDALKAEVAIWKKEVWSDGATRWVDPPAT